MTRIAYDIDAFVNNLRIEQQRALEAALARAPDEGFRASILAQAAMFPAFETSQVAMLHMREAGRPDGFIAMIMGVFARQLLENIRANAERANAEDADAALKVFFEAMSIALSGQARGAEFEIMVPGVIAGTA